MQRGSWLKTTSRRSAEVVRINLRDSRMRRVLDSMDVCQSVLASFFVRVALGQYDLDSSDELIRLLSVITRNKVANQVHHHHAARRDVRRDTSLEGDVLHVARRSEDPSELASAREILRKVSESLSPDERHLAEQRAEGKSWGELSGEMGISDEALRKKLTRAIDRALSECGLEDREHD